MYKWCNSCKYQYQYLKTAGPYLSTAQVPVQVPSTTTLIETVQWQIISRSNERRPHTY